MPRVPPIVPRLAPAVPAALLAGWSTSTFAFWPAHWPLLLAGLAALLSVIGPRLGLVFALAMPILPLGNISLGLAALYAVAAVTWLVLFWPRPRAALLFLAGPVLAAVRGDRASAPRRAAGRRRGAGAQPRRSPACSPPRSSRRLPVTGCRSSAERHPTSRSRERQARSAAVSALWNGLSASSALLLETIALAAAAAAVGACRRRGPWGGAAFGTLLLGATLLADPQAAALPLVAAAWIAALLLSAEPATARPMSALVRRFVPARPRLRAVPGS